MIARIDRVILAGREHPSRAPRVSLAVPIASFVCAVAAIVMVLAFDLTWLPAACAFLATCGNVWLACQRRAARVVAAPPPAICVVCVRPFDFDHMGVHLTTGEYVHYPDCLAAWAATRGMDGPVM